MPYIASETLTRLREHLPDYVGGITEKTGKDTYCCPYPGCGSGRKDKGTGGFNLFKNKNGEWNYHCKACDHGGDLIRLVRDLEGLPFREAVEYVADVYGEEIRYVDGSVRKPGERPEEKKMLEKAETEKRHVKSQKDYSAYYDRCRAELEKSKEAQAYLQGRGIDIDTARACGIGFDPEADMNGGEGSEIPKVPRIIIPCGKESYVGRAISDEGNPKYQKMFPVGGTAGIFNLDELRRSDSAEKVVFVTEGAFNALSLAQWGYSAVAINSASNASRFAEMLCADPVQALLIYIPDNDDPGEQAARTIDEALSEMPHAIVRVGAGRYDDLNEYMQKDTGSMVYDVMRIRDRAGDLRKEWEARRKKKKEEEERNRQREEAYAAKPDDIAVYLDYDYVGDIEEYASGGVVSGCFPSFDKKIRGFFPGLYVLGSVPSLGKTTFLWQIADSMATAGHDVIYFSLEQGKQELVTKSVVRRIAERRKKEFGESNEKIEKSPIDEAAINEGQYEAERNWGMEKMRADVGDHLCVVDGNFDLTIGAIWQRMEDARAMGKHPIVFIDYLQLVAGSDSGADRRKEIDDVVKSLRRLTREFHAPVIVVSTLNRQNYNAQVFLESFKETGGIEYTGDCILGMQLSKTQTIVENAESEDAKRDLLEKEKGNPARELEVKCIKKRRGSATFRQKFILYGSQCRFEEVEEVEDDDDEKSLSFRQISAEEYADDWKI